MILGTKNASGGPKIDIGGPCPKPYKNITFWGGFFSPEGGKTSFGVEKCDLGGNLEVFPVLERSVWFWEAQKPQYSYRNIEVSSPGRPGTPQNPENPILELNFTKFHEIPHYFGQNPIFSWIIRFWSVRGGMCALQPLKNHRNYCPFCVPASQGRKLVKWAEIYEIYGFLWNFRKFHKI